MSKPSFVDHLGGAHEAARAVGPEVFAIPGDAACVRAHQHAGGDMVPALWAPRGCQTTYRAQANTRPSCARAYDLERARVGRDRGGVGESLADRFGQTVPGRGAQHFAQAVPRAAPHALGVSGARQVW